MISAGGITRANRSQFIIARMRSSFVFATMFPRFVTGAAKLVSPWFSHPGKQHKKQCFCNNVPSLARPLNLIDPVDKS